MLTSEQRQPSLRYRHHGRSPSSSTCTSASGDKSPGPSPILERTPAIPSRVSRAIISGMAGRRTHPSILTLVILPLQEPQIHKEIEDIDELKPYSPASQ